MKQERLYWIGPRESDIQDCKELFIGSITTFGSNRNGNIAMRHDALDASRININTMKSNDFVWEKIDDVCSSDPQIKFIFYNGNDFSSIGWLRKYRDRFLCLNDSILMRNLCNKIFFHDNIKNALDGQATFLETHIGNRDDCDYNYVCRKFGYDFVKARQEKIRFIFQAPVASGGNGTFVLDWENGEEIKKEFIDTNCLFSVYHEKNVSVNIHAIIFESEILLTHGSVQLISEDASRLIYHGADFISYNKIDELLKKQFKSAARCVARVIQKMGYRGICGIDAIIYDGAVQLIEINNRFQGSSYLINKALNKHGLRTLQEINIDSFYGKNPLKNDYLIQMIDVPFSNYSYLYNDQAIHANHVLSLWQKEKDIDSIQLDGYHHTKTLHEQLAYLYRVTFSKNISCMHKDGTIRIHENICEPLKLIKDEIIAKNPLYLEVALLTQGIILSEKALKYFEEIYEFCHNINCALDIRFSGGNISGLNSFLAVNIPREIKFVSLSPFHIELCCDASDEKQEYMFELYYYDVFLDKIKLYPHIILYK